MAVDIDVTLADARQTYGPGDALRGSVRIFVPTGETLKNAEVSVLWLTEGKGDTDMGVIYLKEIETQAAMEYPFDTVLPLLPLSYKGHLIKIHWMVRVRASVTHEKETVYDHPFVVATQAQPQ